MADIFTKKKRSEIMSRVKNKDSKIEIAFRKALWKKGFRYRKNATNYFGKPDLVLKRYNTVIFIDSCYWHGCKKHCVLPKTNIKFWKNKILNNTLRDKMVNRHYKKTHYLVCRIWEHSINEKVTQRIIEKIRNQKKI